MGLYVRKDSPFYWVLFERRGRRCLRESTMIPIGDPASIQGKELRRQALDFYHTRMADFARIDGLTRPITPPATRQRVQRSPKGWCYVYIVQQGEMVKIGRAVNPNKRLSVLQAGNGNAYTVLAMIPAHPAIETAIQQHFAYLRQQGEWFAIDAHLMAFIDRVKQGKNPIALLWAAPQAATDELADQNVALTCTPQSTSQ